MKQFLKNTVVRIITWQAHKALKRHKPRIIAITGNVGKTSTKDAIYAVVSRAFFTRKTEKSMNSEIGLPLTILGLDNAWSSLSGWIKNITIGFRVAFLDTTFPQWLVLEVGADHPGDIESVSKWLAPDIVVLTRMSEIPVHLEYFTDAEAVLREKMFLAHALKSDGTLVINADCPQFMKATAPLTCKKVFYGKGTDTLVQIKDGEVVYDTGALPLPLGERATLLIDGKEYNLTLHDVIGGHLIYGLATACAVASVMGIEHHIVQAFEDFKTPKGRMKLIPGMSHSVIVDDTYNASPLATVEALRALGGLSLKGRKIAVLADMKELGHEAEKAHRTIGRRAFEQVHTLVCVGELGLYIAEGAREAGIGGDRLFTYPDAETAGKALRDMVRAGDVILVKGSQSMRMERVTKALMDNPHEAENLLVRQESEWTRR